MNKANTDHRDDAYKYRELYEKLKLLVWALGVAGLYLLLTYFFPLPDPTTQTPHKDWPIFEPKDGWLEVRMALGGALISFSAFGAIMQLLHFKSLDREVAGALRRVFSDSVPLIEGFSRKRKREFVANALEAQLGSDVGFAAFNHIEPMLKNGAGFRQDFNYRVWLKDAARSTTPEEFTDNFPQQNYRWVVEELSYKLINIFDESSNSDLFQYSNGPFKIVFLFDKTSLDRLNPDQSIFGRFLIELDEKELDWVCGLKSNLAVDFVRRAFEPELSEVFNHTEEKVPTTIRRMPALADPKGRCKPYFEVEMKSPLTAPAGTSKLKLLFTYPYSRSVTHFTFSMPQPVHSPKLSFDFSQADLVTDSVDLVTYLSCDQPDKVIADSPSEHDLTYGVNVDGAWVFPSSGVVIVWQNED